MQKYKVKLEQKNWQMAFIAVISDLKCKRGERFNLLCMALSPHLCAF